MWVQGNSRVVAAGPGCVCSEGTRVDRSRMYVSNYHLVALVALPSCYNMTVNANHGEDVTWLFGCPEAAAPPTPYWTDTLCLLRGPALSGKIRFWGVASAFICWAFSSRSGAQMKLLVLNIFLFLVLAR